MAISAKDHKLELDVSIAVLTEKQRFRTPDRITLLAGAHRNAPLRFPPTKLRGLADNHHSVSESSLCAHLEAHTDEEGASNTLVARRRRRPPQEAELCADAPRVRSEHFRSQAQHPTQSSFVR